MIRSFIQLIKIPHYVKNLFVLLPLFFSTQLMHPELILKVLFAFVSFCLMSGSVYIFNDIGDLSEDQRHPEKKLRPIASGRISIQAARATELSLAILSVLVCLLVSTRLAVVLVSYKVLNILYTFYLKKIVIADVITISLGFVLRLLAGSVSTGIGLSFWIVIMTFLLALLIALGKRRIDVIYFRQHDIKLRKVVSSYPIPALNRAMLVISSLTIGVYALYTLDPGNKERIGTDFLFITLIWVIAGVLRYLQLIFLNHSTDTPVQMLLKDHPLKLILLAWGLNFYYLIYL